MHRSSRRRRRSKSLSSSLSHSRSRSRDRHRRKSSHRNRDKHRKYPRSRSPKDRRHSRSNGNRSNLKKEDDKIKHESKKSVKFDEKNIKSTETKEDKKEKQKEDFNASGALKRDLETTKNGVILKYNEPPEGTMSDRKWRLYVYKNDEQINLFHLHRKSFFLIGRDERVKCMFNKWRKDLHFKKKYIFIQVADVVCRHISVSSQHAVIQYRRVKVSKDSNKKHTVIKPYIMDLKSRHGTYLMGDKLEAHRFYELLPKDKIQFGRSTREYIVLAADSIQKDLENKSEIKLSDEENDKEEDKEKKETYNIWSDDDD